MEQPSPASRHLAQNIENLRGKKQLSQQQLADIAGIPRSTLTNIESGAGNPSLSNLVKISEALGVSVEELLSRPRSECTLIAADRVPVSERSRGQVKVYKLLPEQVKGIEIDRMEFVPGALMGGHPHLVGTKEYLTVIQGEVLVQVAGQSYPVRKSDVLAFPGNQPHSYRNSGASNAIAISVVIPVPASV
jgi:transcriptional regulator with XRE-family HTH domain